jgi:hypothetical protein
LVQDVAIGLDYIALWLRRFSIQGENLFYFLFFRLKALHILAQWQNPKGVAPWVMNKYRNMRPKGAT